MAARPGGFVAAWWGFADGDNFARFYDFSGIPAGDAPFVTSDVFLPASIAVMPSGDFVIAGFSGAGEIFYRRFAADGTPAGPDVSVDPGAPNDYPEPVVAVDENGNDLRGLEYLQWRHRLRSAARGAPSASTINRSGRRATSTRRRRTASTSSTPRDRASW